MLNRPTAIIQAKKLAQEAAGRSLTYNHIWIVSTSGLFDEYQVRYVLPNTEGFFSCNIALTLSFEEFRAYEAWTAEQY